MTDSTKATPARELPDGTVVRTEDAYGTLDYIAFPEHNLAGQKVRWHSETTIMSDRGMDSLLADGATVVGMADAAAMAQWAEIVR